MVLLTTAMGKKGMAAALDNLEAMGFRPQQARRAYRLLPPEAKKGSLSLVVACAAELISDGAVPKVDDDEAPVPRRQLSASAQPKSRPAATAKRKTRVGAVGLLKRPRASTKKPRPQATTPQPPATRGPTSPMVQRPMYHLPKPQHWPFENVGRLQEAVAAGEEGFSTLKARVLHGVGPKDQAWLSTNSLGTLGQLKTLTESMAVAVGTTQAQVAKLKTIRCKVLGAYKTLSM